MKDKKTIKGVQNIVETANAESYTVSKTLLKKFLTKKAYDVVTTPAFNTALDRYIKDENQVAGTKGWRRKAFLIEYMNLKFKSKPGTKEIKELCNLINKCVKNDDIFDCSLGLPTIMPFPQGCLGNSKPVKKKDQVWCLMYFGLSKISIEELRQKYGEIFVYEGTLPELFYPELKKKIKKDHKKMIIDDSQY